jgi:hypothetical protein
MALQRVNGGSTADLKFLHRLPQIRPQEFQIESGTGIIELLVSL